jgi:hypothetical protein
VVEREQDRKQENTRSFEILWPDADFEQVAAAKGRLEVSGTSLRARTREEVLAPLCRVLDSWRDPDSVWRKRLADELPGRAGFSAANFAAGLDLGLSEWTGDALRSLVASELDGRLDGRLRSATHRLSPFDTTSVVLAGCIPNPTLLHCIVPLLLHSPVMLKTASRDPITAGLVAESIAAEDEELGRCIEVTSFPSDDRASLETLLDAACIVASGSDETIASLRRSIPNDRRLVAYGHKLSIAVLGSDACEDDTLDETARAIALDVSLWDQLGCLSPVAVYVMDSAGGESAHRFARALARGLALRAKAAPRGEIDDRTAAAIRYERDGAQMRAAGGAKVAVHSSEGTAYTVVCEDTAEWRIAPLHRFVRVHPVADEAALHRALLPIAPHLSSAALAGFAEGARGGPAANDIATLLSSLGASRVCRPGRLQAPPLGWHHDGRPVLLPLARFSSVEID